MALIQPTGTEQSSLDLGRQFPVDPDLAAIMADPEGCRQCLWRVGERCGWPDVRAGAVRLHGGDNGWRTVLDSLNPNWLHGVWLTINDAIAFWLGQEERKRYTAEPIIFDHLDYGPERPCEDCGGELPGYRVHRCDSCITNDGRESRGPRPEPKQNTAVAAEPTAAKVRRPAAGRRSLQTNGSH